MRLLHPKLALAALLASHGFTSSALALGITDLVPGDLIITEYLANPVGVADTDAEYFEIYNRRGETIDLTGLVIRDDGSNEFAVDSLSIGAGEFAVFSNGNGVTLGFDVDFNYGRALALTNGADEIVLSQSDGTEIFRLTYSDGDFFGAGVAHELVKVAGGLSAAAGPVTGTNYQAAVASLLLDNFGSPGRAGGTDLATVPVPGAAWLLGSALACTGAWARRRRAGTLRSSIAASKLQAAS